MYTIFLDACSTSPFVQQFCPHSLLVGWHILRYSLSGTSHSLYTVSIELMCLNVLSFLGWLTMLTLQSGPVFAERWNIVWCGSCPWTAGEYLAPGVPDPPSLKGLIRVGGVAVEVNDVVQDVTGAIVQIADAIDA
ncbi:uncharacterized protein LOC142356591 [Convolutriloba macropyga]|uniref:uncharacterized protein LOC142356591 n=1 Tax=Convolutriloba macropyga TaxID=536237 RepID=UPI003F51EC8D